MVNHKMSAFREARRLAGCSVALLLLLLFAQSSSALESDDFNTCAVDSNLWRVDDPRGDGTVQIQGAGTGDSKLNLSVPAGVSHNPWATNTALQLLQPAADTDFALEAKFDSPLSAQFQMQGLLVKESATRFLRFELYSRNTGVFAFAAFIDDGSASALSTVAVPATTAYIRVERVGDLWNFHTSEDGVVWTLSDSFTQSLVVNEVGPHAGNYGTGNNAPAHTAVIDYFQNAAAPLEEEDVGVPPDTVTLTATPLGSGSVSLSPDGGSYTCGQVVEIEAIPDVGFEFVEWTGDISSTDPVLEIGLVHDLELSASFQASSDSTSPVISDIQIASSWNSATVSWTTDEPTVGAVAFGEDTSYELGTVEDSTLAQEHSLTLVGLQAGTIHHLQITATDSAGNQTVSADQSFSTVSDLSAIYSDDFNTCAVDSTLWRVEDPRGDGTVQIQGAGTGDSKLNLSVPAGVSHNPWKNNTALQLLQPAADTDFSLETKFDSPLSAKYQMQGLLVKESATRFLRFELYSSDTGVFAFAAFIDEGSASALSTVSVSPTTAYIWVERAGDLWSFYTSEDGNVWTLSDSFTQSLVVTEIGPHAGNYGTGNNAPAHTAVIDYFQNLAAPLEQEDVGVPPDTVTLTASALGSGSVSLSPDQASYTCGQVVEIEAIPDVGFEFVDWTGDVSSNESVLEIGLVRDTELFATFQADLTPPLILGEIRVVAGATGAEIHFTTDDPTTYEVRYGISSAYELGTVSVNEYSTEHKVVLTGLQPETEYHFQIELQNSALLSSVTPDKMFVTSVAPGSAPAGIFSDDFNSCVIDSGIWDVLDPMQDATISITGAGAGDARLEITVPAGKTHEPWESNTAPRLMQSVSDTDFELEIRFDSPLTERYQEQGLLVEQDAQNYLRFDFHSNGSSNFAFAASVESSVAQVEGSSAIESADTMYMRVTRVGDQWTQSYSYDAMNWQVANQFDHVLLVNSVGFFAGNAGGGLSPEHTAVVDYFWTTSSPTVPEDFGAVGGAKTLTLNLDGPGDVAVDPDQDTYGCGESVNLTAVPDLGFVFDGWSGDLSGNDLSEALLMTVDRDVTASFVLDIEPPIISNVEIYRGPSDALVLWTTNEPATSQVAYGETTDYELGSVTDPTFKTNHSMVISGLDGQATYNFKITSVDGASFSTSTGNIVSEPGEGPEIDIFYGLEQVFGVGGLGQPWINILGNVTDPDGVASVTYSLNGGTETSLSLGWDRYRLDVDGDFNADIPSGYFTEGENTVAIRALDLQGNESLSLVTANFTENVVPTLPYTIDWSNQASIQDVAQIVDGDWIIEGDTVRNQEMGYDRLLAIGDYSWTDYEATVHLTVNEFEPYYESPSNGPAIGLVARWAGHVADGRQPAVQWWPLGVYAYHRPYEGGGADNRLLGDPGELLDSQWGTRISEGVEYVFKVRIETLPDGSSLYSFKKWPATDAEPSEWLLQGIEAAGNDVPSGSLLIVAHHADVSVGQVSILPITPSAD